MAHTCPECGGILGDDMGCQAIFESFLGLKFADPGYGGVHMLTVACFMIQHGRYSDEGLRWIADKLHAYLENGTPVEQVRRQAAWETDQGRRSWRVARRPGARPQSRIAWSFTIADVAAKYQDAASYCVLVRDWARTTLREMKPLLAGS